MKWFGRWWITESCKGTFAIGIQVIKSKGVKSGNVVFGGRSIQHHQILLQVKVLRWTISRRFWLRGVNDAAGQVEVRDPVKGLVETDFPDGGQRASCPVGSDSPPPDGFNA